MLKQIQDYINAGEYEKARTCMDSLLQEDVIYDDTLAVLDASIYEALGKPADTFRAIRRGLQASPDNYELYYMLGYYYMERNVDQAYLCFQNALHYCHDEADYRMIAADRDTLENSGQVRVKNTAIVIVSYNGCYLLQKCIESIRNTLPQEAYQIVVVDNASHDGVEKWLQEQKDIFLLSNSENAGFPAACNQGVQALQGTPWEDYDIFLLNNDTRLAKNSLFWLRMGLYERKDIGAAGSCSNYAGNDQELKVEFPMPADYVRFGASINIPQEDPCEERVRLSGFAMLIHGEVWDKAGGFDEAFSPGYFEDDDLSMKILQSGFRLVLCHNSFVYHAGSQSFAKKRNVEELLTAHHRLFQQKYGFDILQYAYPNVQVLEKIPFGTEEEFNLLQIGSGIGADLKYLHSRFPNAHLIGIEPDEALLVIAQKTEVVFQNMDALTEIFTQPVFQVLLINPEEYSRMSAEDAERMEQMCRKDCIVLPKAHSCNNIHLEQVKLVIWDLDNTFWEGILSEGDVKPLEKNITLVQNLTDCGIVNSVSSKNDKAEALVFLEKIGMDKYFVFPNINWQNKGEQIRQKLLDMHLRAENVLFVDDDIRNLEEAKYYNPGIMTAEPDILPTLAARVAEWDKKDVEHKRLASYKMLEQRQKIQSDFASKEQFLYYSEIRISVENDCLDEIERIAELVSRTNQLNYTKIRDSKEELQMLLRDRQVGKGYVRVRDRFGDYGIVGFYCFDYGNRKLRHFLFSCRVMGMGIPQYMYNLLGNPDVDVVEPVAEKVLPNVQIPWIHMEEPTKASLQGQERLSDTRNNKVKILLKGPCDLSTIESYLSGGDVTTEFNFVNEQGFITTGQNHSMHIWESAVCSEQQIEEIVKDVPFITREDFQTNLFSREYHVIGYSLLPDCHAGLYRNKRTGAYISFGSRNFDLTAPENRNGYIDGSIVNHCFPFTEEIIDKFAQDWEFVGVTTGEQLIRNLDYMYTHTIGNPTWILLLGSEIEYEGINEEFADHAAHHKEINDLVKSYAVGKDRIKLIETTDYIKSQADYADCINHFSRNVYYDLATAMCRCINETIKK